MQLPLVNTHSPLSVYIAGELGKLGVEILVEFQTSGCTTERNTTLLFSAALKLIL